MTYIYLSKYRRIAYGEDPFLYLKLPEKIFLRRSLLDEGVDILRYLDSGETFFLSPAEFFEKEFETAIVDVNNPVITNAHLVCSAFEIPIDEKDKEFYDKTLEGLKHKTLPIFAVQYHPEASPGPHESQYLFDRFIDLMEKHA